MSRTLDKNKTKNNTKGKVNNILVNKKKFGPEGYFGSLTKKFFFQFSLVPEENILCDIKINNSIKCFFSTLKTYKKEKISSKFFEEIKERIKKDNQKENNGKIYLLFYLDIKVEEEENSSKESIKNLKHMLPQENINFLLQPKKTEEKDEISIKLEQIEKDLKDINEFCILNNIKLILSTNFEECAQCIYQLTTLKINIRSLQSPKDNIVNNDTLIDMLCKIEGINKTDAVILLNYYKSFKKICIATENNELCTELNILPLEYFTEIDERKKKSIYAVFHNSLKKSK